MQLKVGNIKIGDGAPVTVQSMTNTVTSDALATITQIKSLATAGCDIIRVALPDRRSIAALPEILEAAPIPVIGDIHFDHRLALEAIKAGIHGIRINPGNIGSEEKVREVAEFAGEAGISIRVGSNSGSLPGDIVEKFEGSNLPYYESRANMLVESAVTQCKILEKYGFNSIKVSLKSSDVRTMITANRQFVGKYQYPLHLGVTEAGTLMRGTVKSSIGIGTLLQEGIGDTIRVSLTADPIEEVKAGIMILEALGIRSPAPEIISCPTCGRTEIDLMGLAERVEIEVDKLKAAGHKINIAKIAVMGCIVNGPGEAKDADIGIAGSKRGEVSLFKKGVSLGMFPQEEAFARLIEELKQS